MAGIFVDAGAWIALVDPTDGFHAQARSHFQAMSRGLKLYTSNYIVQEVVTWFVYHRKRRFVTPFRDLIDALEAVRWLEIVWATRQLDEHTWRIFDQFDDQRFSFTDCSSIGICRQEQIDTAFSFDRHFPIAGIQRVPQV